MTSTQNFEQMAQQLHDKVQIFSISCHETLTTCSLGPTKNHYTNILNLSTNLNKEIRLN